MVWLVHSPASERLVAGDATEGQRCRNPVATSAAARRGAGQIRRLKEKERQRETEREREREQGTAVVLKPQEGLKLYPVWYAVP